MSLARVRNKPTRAGYDLSRKINYTSKCGEYLPVLCVPVMTTDDLRIALQQFARTQPLNASAFARIRTYYNFYFVPLQQMWNKGNTLITQMLNNVQHASGRLLSDNIALSGKFPYFTSQQLAEYVTALDDKVNEFGLYRAWCTCKLLEYLRYGRFYDYITTKAGGKGYTWTDHPMLNNNNHSPFPLFAYQKIYSDRGRYTQWERSNPATFNCDYIKGTDDLQMDLSGEEFVNSFNFLDMRYCNWQKDLLHGVIPQAQYGEASVVDSDPLYPIVDFGSSPGGTVVLGSGDEQGSEPNVTAPIVGYYLNGTSESSTVNRTNPIENLNSLIRLNPASISILALRRAEAAQKWKEVTLCSEEDYASQIEAHHGKKVSPLLSDSVSWLGSVEVNLDINEVVNTNITGDYAADIAGKAVQSGSGSVSFQGNGLAGYLCCVVHTLPIVDYITSAPDFSTLLTDATDWPIPEFDRIGMEPVPVVRGLNPVLENKGTPPISPETYFGYAPRYFDWKTALDYSMGAFATTLKHWIVPFDDEQLLEAAGTLFPNNPNVEEDSINAGFFKVSPRSLDMLFAVEVDSTLDTDQFLNSCFFKISAVRDLDPDGLPY